MKSIISILFAVVAISTLTLMYFLTSEKEDNSFNNYQALKESGLIEKGWVPAFIPKSAHNIKEHHRVDVADIYIEFYFKENDNLFLTNNCIMESQNTYVCENNGYPVKIIIKNNNHAAIQRI
jgi:hypothetical protein